jgi:bacterioferritin-associated ferredoxin
VQFWLEFKGRPAVGKPGDPDFTPEEGTIYYYLYDVDKKEKVANWLMGFSMMEGPPPSGPYPMTNIVTEGNTARFDAFDMKWTVVDGGEGYAKDRVTVDDGFKPREMKMYDGDLRVVSAQPKGGSKDQACTGCHTDPAKNMSTRGGKHNTMGCADCHVGHPPEVKKPVLKCTQCHEPHSPGMTEAACHQCHRAHTASAVMYAYNVPSHDCAVCHEKAAEVLTASRSKHASLGCALCHPDKHKATVNCQHCHSAPHPAQVMKDIGSCGKCHNTAHQILINRRR